VISRFQTGNTELGTQKIIVKKTTTYLFPVSTTQNRPMSEFASPHRFILALICGSLTGVAAMLKALETLALHGSIGRLRHV
jgi:hypothetical protein